MHGGDEEHVGDDVVGVHDDDRRVTLSDDGDEPHDGDVPSEVDSGDDTPSGGDELHDGDVPSDNDPSGDELSDGEHVQVADASVRPESRALPIDPLLPSAPVTPAAPPPEIVQPTPGSDTWYRTDQDRNRSVYRLANPWYRRVARGVIAMSFIAALGVGLYFGARLVQDYLDRDRLPSPGVEVPTIRATSIELRSTSPAPVLDGTLTLDAQTGAFEFVGRGTGTQAGAQVVSPDGATVYSRDGAGPWQVARSDDRVARDVALAVSYLRDDDSADDILTSRLRRGFVDLIDRTEVGEGDAELRRYEMRLDTANFGADFPLQYREFEERAIPGVRAVRGLSITITLDANDVLVGVDDADTNWSWQRLSYTDQPFEPIDPTDEVLDGSIEVTDGNL